MNQEELQAALEAIARSGITVNGDLVLEKKVDYEVANVETGGIGIQITQTAGEKPTSNLEPACRVERDEEMFHFVHPDLEDEEGWRVHDAVKRLVKRQGMQMICQYLTELKNENRVLLPPNPQAAYTELVRMGMPTSTGFAEKTFDKYYNR
jgi:hypothetical protein